MINPLKFLLSAALFLVPMTSFAQFTGPQTAYLHAKNLLRNPGFEAALAGWTGDASTLTTTSAKASGSVAVVFDSTNASQVLKSTAITLTSGQGPAGQNGVASCKYKTTATDYKLQVVDGSGNVLTSNASTDVIPPSTEYSRYTHNFIFPTSGTVALQTISGSSAAAITVDDCWVGLADEFNLSQVSQARIYGDLKYAGTASCSWTTTGTAIAVFSADTDCPTPTVTGYAAAPSTKIPGVTFTNLPPGDYEATAYFRAVTTGSSSCFYKMSDGTSLGPTAHATLPSDVYTAVTGKFSYTAAQSSVTFQIQAYRSGGTNCQISAINSPEQDFYIVVKRFPSSSEQGLRTDQMPASWSGYHDGTCSWGTTSASYVDPTADSSCTFTELTNRNFGTVTSALSGSDKLPGVVFTPAKTGIYEVCARTSASNSSVAQRINLQLTDGTTVADEVALTEPAASEILQANMCGNWNFTSTAAKTVKIQMKTNSGTNTMGSALGRSITWRIRPLDQAASAPIFVGSVTSQSTGQERIERASIGTIAARCTSTPCTITSQSGSWLSSVSRGSTGNYTLNITAGTFSAAPQCVFTDQFNDDTSYRLGAQAAGSVALSTYDISSAAASDAAFNVICMGPR